MVTPAEALRAELLQWGARLQLRAAGYDGPGIVADLTMAAHVMLKAHLALGHLDASAKALFVTEIATGPALSNPSEN